MGHNQISYKRRVISPEQFVFFFFLLLKGRGLRTLLWKLVAINSSQHFFRTWLFFFFLNKSAYCTRLVPDSQVYKITMEKQEKNRWYKFRMSVLLGDVHTTLL